MKYLESMKTTDDDGWLSKATSSRKENVSELILIEQDLKEIYTEYTTLIENYQIDLEFSDFLTSKDLLKDFYEHPPKELNYLLKARRNEHGLTECPFCGNPVSPDTLDHFIPKTQWPEYSIYPNNLIPQCRDCAPTKGDDYYCVSENSVKFIHPFFSNLLGSVKFKINVEFNNTTFQPSFTVKLITPPGTDEPSKKRVLLHAKELNFKQRIIKYCYREYYNWKAKLSSNSFDIKDALKQRMKEKSETDLSKDWKTALYQGLLAQEELINYLNSIEPSENPKAIEAMEAEQEHDL